MKFPAGNGCWMMPSTQITVSLVPVRIQQLEAADEDPVEFIIRPGSGVSMDSMAGGSIDSIAEGFGGSNMLEQDAASRRIT